MRAETARIGGLVFFLALVGLGAGCPTTPSGPEYRECTTDGNTAWNDNGLDLSLDLPDPACPFVIHDAARTVTSPAQ